jgi:hypothetical protein
MLRGVALVRADVSEELRASFIMVTRIGELGTTHAAHDLASFYRWVGSCSDWLRSTWSLGTTANCLNLLVWL